MRIPARLHIGHLGVEDDLLAWWAGYLRKDITGHWLCKPIKPRMTFRMGELKRVLEPVFLVRVEQWQARVKVEPIFLTIPLGLIEQLDFDTNTRNTSIGHNQIVTLTANHRMAPANPCIAISVYQHDLELPGLGIGLMPSNIVDADGQPFRRSARLSRSRHG
jgi:hypothetical protein